MKPDARGHCLDQGRSVLARAALWQRRVQAHPLDADTCVRLVGLLTPSTQGMRPRRRRCGLWVANI